MSSFLKKVGIFSTMAGGFVAGGIAMTYMK